MKVLFISRLYPNEYDVRNGAVMHRQALELIRNDIDVRVLSPVPFVPKIIKNIRSKWTEYYSLPFMHDFEGVKIYHPRFVDLPFGLNDGALHKSIIKSTEKVIDSIYDDFPFDIIHTHMGYPDNFAGIFIKNKYNLPLLTTIRSTDMDITIKKHKTKKKLEESLICSDQIISPSLQLSKKLENNFNLNSIHIGNGIYPLKLSQEVKESKVNSSELMELESRTSILSISNLIESKGIQYNILAVSKLVSDFPDILYLIIGDGPYKEKLITLVNDLNLSDHVRFLGAVEHGEAMIYLTKCDIFSLPSWRETFGLVYLEAMYFNKPVILCENQALDEAIQHNYNGIVVPVHSVDPIVDNVKNLLNNPSVKNEISAKGNELVLRDYTWDRIGNQLGDVYNKLYKNRVL